MNEVLVRCNRCGCLRRPDALDAAGRCKEWSYCTERSRSNGADGPQLPKEPTK